MTDPWATAEWRAHCASERKRFREGACFKLMLEASASGVSVRIVATVVDVSSAATVPKTTESTSMTAR